MVAMRWDAFELVEIKGREKGSEYMSEVKIKMLNYRI